MNANEVKGRLKLVRFGGLVVTIMVFTILVAVLYLVGMMTGDGGKMIGDALGYIVLGTAIAAALSFLFYFGYRAFLMRQVKPA